MKEGLSYNPEDAIEFSIDTVLGDSREEELGKAENSKCVKCGGGKCAKCAKCASCKHC